jgi:hypothetical protein
LLCTACICSCAFSQSLKAAYIYFHYYIHLKTGTLSGAARPWNTTCWFWPKDDNVLDYALFMCTSVEILQQSLTDQGGILFLIKSCRYVEVD